MFVEDFLSSGPKKIRNTLTQTVILSLTAFHSEKWEQPWRNMTHFHGTASVLSMFKLFFLLNTDTTQSSHVKTKQAARAKLI